MIFGCFCLAKALKFRSSAQRIVKTVFIGKRWEDYGVFHRAIEVNAHADVPVLLGLPRYSYLFRTGAALVLGSHSVSRVFTAANLGRSARLVNSFGSVW